jgi:hypothetical protein
MLSCACEACLSAYICLLTYSSTLEACILSKGVTFVVRREGGEHAGVVVALLTYCEGPGKGNSVLADL